MQLREKSINLILAARNIALTALILLFAAKLAAGEVQETGSGQALIEEVGIQGSWKLGQSCNVRVAVPSSLRDQAVAVSITTLDGDGVEVVYTRQLDKAPLICDVPVRIGKRESVLSAALLDKNGNKITSEDKDLATTTGLSETQPMVVCIGASMGLEELVRASVDGTQQSLSILTINDTRSLPSTVLAYQPCSFVVISTTQLDTLRAIQPQQWQALDQWIRRGGGCIVSLSGVAKELQSIEGLLKLLPGSILDDANVRSPAALESMIITEQQLKPFPAIQITAERGQIQLGLKDTLARQIPWWVTSAHGHGSVQVVASDLAHDSFAKWKQRKNLWERLISPYVDKNSLEVSQTDLAESTSYLGYSDLTGQLRASLDQFQAVSAVGFSQVAGVLVLILLLIGPVDYLLSVKLFKRPDLSWPLAGAMLLVSCIGLTWYYQQLRPNQVITNSLQLIDIDTQSGQIDGHLWSHVYSAHARPLNISASYSPDNRPLFIDWQGLPGKGLGGLQSQLTMISGFPTYAIDIQPEGSTEVSGVGVPSAGTKSLYGTFSGPSTLTNTSNLRELSTVDQLEGELVNPLDVDLKDVTLYYHRWYYSLSSRLAAGQRFKLSSQVIPKDIVRRLNKQQDFDGKASSARWNPAERNDLDRLLELMMFHNAATGSNYTSLSHNYQPILDHSKLLESNNAVLIGRLEASPIQLSVSPTHIADEPKIESGIDRAWCRIVIPVDTGRVSSTP